MVEEELIPHPDIATLVRYRDRELPYEQRTAIEAHLGNCTVCRMDLDLLKVAMTGARKEANSGMTLDILDGVRSKLRGWETRRAHELSPEAVRDRVAVQIGPYLGTRAARKVLELVAPNNQNVLSVVEPVLSEFLGRSAAAALVDRVVESAIVNI